MFVKKTVVGRFDDGRQALRLVSDLKKAGISGNSIKVVDEAELDSQEGIVGQEASRREGVKGLLKRFLGSHIALEFESEQDSSDLDWIRHGGILVAAKTDESHAKRVTEIMDAYGDKNAPKRNR